MKKLYHIYSLFFAIAYIVIYVDYEYVKYIDGIIILLSYYLILVREENEPIVMLALFSRCINGFMSPGNLAFYNIFNALSGYVPLLLVSLKYFSSIRKQNNIQQAKRRKSWTVLYILILILFSLTNLELSMSIFPMRIMPLLMFLIFVNVVKEDINLYKIILYFRYTFISFIIVYFFLSPANTSIFLLDSVVFKESVGVMQYYIAGTIFRNLGAFWDSRILGMIAIGYLYIILLNKYRYRYADIILSVIVLLTSFSRGSIVIAVLLLIAAIIEKNLVIKKSVIITFISILGISTFYLVSSSSQLQYFSKTFLLGSENNAIEQRSIFLDYALETFKENPFGNGVGYLRSKNSQKYFGSEEYGTVTDAYIFILLSEIGVIGFPFFILSLKEILLVKRKISIAFFIGFIIQLIGTDVPDMGLFYFSYIALFYLTNHINQEEAQIDIRGKCLSYSYH